VKNAPLWKCCTRIKEYKKRTTNANLHRKKDNSSKKGQNKNIHSISHSSSLRYGVAYTTYGMQFLTNKQHNNIEIIGFSFPTVNKEGHAEC